MTSPSKKILKIRVGNETWNVGKTSIEGERIAKRLVILLQKHDEYFEEHIELVDQTWQGRLDAVWHERYGSHIAGGELGKNCKELVVEHGLDEVAQAMRRYVGQAGPRASLHHFARTYSEWRTPPAPPHPARDSAQNERAREERLRNRQVQVEDREAIPRGVGFQDFKRVIEQLRRTTGTPAKAD